MITWKKDGEYIPTSRHRYYYASFHTELIIENVQSSDEAMYTCHGANDIGTSEQTIFLDVQGTLIEVIRFLGLFSNAVTGRRKLLHQ